MSDKQAIIMSGGTLPQEDNFYRHFLQQESFKIAADAGFQVFLRLKLTPDLLIGDLDSLSTEEIKIAKEKHIPLNQYSANKDESDTQLALDIAIAKEYNNVLILGGIGSRLDHTLANLFLLLYAKEKNVEAKIINPWHEIYIVTDGDTLEISGEKGELVSLIPISPSLEELTLKGLQWELNKAFIARGHSKTLSNQLKDTKASINLKKGIAFVLKVQE